MRTYRPGWRINGIFQNRKEGDHSIRRWSPRASGPNASMVHTGGAPHRRECWDCRPNTCLQGVGCGCREPTSIMLRRTYRGACRRLSGLDEYCQDDEKTRLCRRVFCSFWVFVSRGSSPWRPSRPGISRPSWPGSGSSRRWPGCDPGGQRGSSSRACRGQAG